MNRERRQMRVGGSARRDVAASGRRRKAEGGKAWHGKSGGWGR